MFLHDEDDDDDEVVDRIMDDIDEKNGLVRGSIDNASIRQSQLQINSIILEQQEDFTSALSGIQEPPVPNDTINLGPNLDLQVSAIGHLRRRKKGPKDCRQECISQQECGDMEDEGVHFKLMNNSTVMPLKHSRYTNDES